MRVLHVIDSGGLYGAEIVLLTLMREQERKGLHPVLASIGEPTMGVKAIEQEARRRRLRVVPVRMRPGLNLAGAVRLATLARAERSEILHGHGYKADILLGLLPRRQHPRLLVSTLHGWTSTRRLTRIWAYERLHALLLRRQDGVVLVNEGVRRHAHYRHARPRREWVVANGIDLRELESGGHDPSSPSEARVEAFCRGAFVIGAVGRLAREKGFTCLLEAFARLAGIDPALRLLIIGEGPVRGELERRSQEMGVDHGVLLPGYLPSAHRWLRRFDVFVLSSLTEGLPLALLEAMAVGTPVVATAVGGVPSLIHDGREGLLVAPGDPAALARAIDRVRHDRDLAADLVDRARCRVREHHSSEAMADGYHRVYESLGGVRSEDAGETFRCCNS